MANVHRAARWRGAVPEQDRAEGVDMIRTIGFCAASPKRVREVRAVANGTFCAVLPDAFGCPPRAFVGGELLTGALALKFKNVAPHTDPYVGNGEEPDAYFALFWLVDIPQHEWLWLQVGNESVQMRQGDFVVFDDQVMHSVQSSRQWFGCAWQIELPPMDPE